MNQLHIPGVGSPETPALRIYVDQMMPTPITTKWHWPHACHLFHEFHDLDALDRFAVGIGCKVRWRHNATGFPHYDLHHRHRALAVAAGAIEIDRRHPVMLAMFQRRREWLAAQKAVRSC